MASGDRVVSVLEVMPPATSFSYKTTLVGGSSPAESVRVWTFPDAASTYLDLKCALKGYSGGGLTFRLAWSSLATTNAAVWQLAVRRFDNDVEDLDAAQTYDFNTVTQTAPGNANRIVYATLTFTSGADMDSWADNELAIVRVLRDPANASDTLANTAYLWGLWGFET